MLEIDNLPASYQIYTPRWDRHLTCIVQQSNNSGYGLPRNVMNYHLSGNGRDYGKAFLKECWNDQMTMEQVAVIGYFVIKYIEEFKFNYTVGGEPMIWFIPDDERDEFGEKMDYLLQEKRPEQFESVKNKAMRRLHKHKKEIHDLFT